MLNKQPIFITGFQRGGSNILLNLLRSHPAVCSPRGELGEVFRIKRKFPPEPVPIIMDKFFKSLPVIIRQRENVFSPHNWKERKPFFPATSAWIDKILYYEKLKARSDSQNRFKSEGIEYNDDEIRKSRLLCKNLNGLILLTDNIMHMYPDAVFFAIIRNGYAVCEGQTRRGVPLELAARNYQKGCQRMMADSEAYEQYYILRYEDIMANPINSLKNIYKLANLNISSVRKIRLETKAVLDESGRHIYTENKKGKELVWYNLDEFSRHFKLNANANQIKRLDKFQIDLIHRFAGEALDHFNY